MKIRSVLSMLLCACVLLSAVPMPQVCAAQITEPVESGNYSDHEYIYDRWASPIKSYLVPHDNGTLTRVENVADLVTVETYDRELNFVSGQTIEMELPVFGGFYYGETCNFLVFGQNNPNESDNVEVIRVVSYTRDWQRIASASLYGANTCIPFDAGSLRFAEYNGYLYIRTAHEMYTSSDGLNHQANLTMNVRIADMVITDSFYKIMNIEYGFVSHSFNQFIGVDGTALVAVDHGDAHPRSVVLMRYLSPAGQDQFTETVLKPTGQGYYVYSCVEYVDVLPIAGGYGDNDTGVSLGGFEISDTAYLIAGNTVSQGEDYDPFGQRNIFVTATSKSNFSADGTQIHYLTSYSAGDNVKLSNPQFTKISDTKFAVIWMEEIDNHATMRYAFVDGNGQLIGEIYSGKGALSDCQPVVFENKLVWYVTGGSKPAFMTIDLENPENSTCDHVYIYEYVEIPSTYFDGMLSSACAICDEAGPTVTVPAIKNYDAYTLMFCTKDPTCTETGEGFFRWKEIDRYNLRESYFFGVVPALGHEWGEKGEDGHAPCIRCDEIHNWIDATCEAPSTCIACGLTRGEPIGHDYGPSEITLRPTCTQTGLRAQTCRNCKDQITEVIPALGHTTFKVTVEPECETEGYTVYLCRFCDYKAIESTVPALGHSYESVVTEPTLTESGYTTHTCTTCGHSYVDSEVPALGMGISGTVTSYLEGDATVELLKDGQLMHSTTASGGSYHFAGLEAGTYVLRVSKENHASREYTVTVDLVSVRQDVTIYPAGDVTGDGKVTIKDFQRMLRHVNESSLLEGYAYACGDVTGDGKVTIKDFQRLLRHVNESKPLY